MIEDEIRINGEFESELSKKHVLLSMMGDIFKEHQIQNKLKKKFINEAFQFTGCCMKPGYVFIINGIKYNDIYPEYQIMTIF
ncbi:MAG: hypothetical protein BZ136_00245 [Methanosphaera sp. rholeuAM74]|nr:MAG: hypothetical protein BZ136_00245 [Methanosphaera sp. rholeuAM74]